MSALTVGATVIPYAVRESAKARSLRITVTPAGVEVAAPVGTPAGEVASYVHRKRRWVFDAVREIAARHQAELQQQYASGARLQYRGRGLMIDVQPGAVDEVAIACRSKFHVTVPAVLLGVDRLAAIEAAFEAWLRARAQAELERLGRHHALTLGVSPAAYRLSDAKARWGSCGRDGTIRVHWRLIQAPAAVFEYVVAHEVAHLRCRHHGPEFWATLAHSLPDWAERKAVLERWEGERRVV